MPLHVYAVALETLREAHPLLERFRRHDRNLFEQATRAASSILLNIAEAEYSSAGNRRSRFHTAAGSANELTAALDLGVAFRYVESQEAAEVLSRLDRIRAMLWRLSHR